MQKIGLTYTSPLPTPQQTSEYQNVLNDQEKLMGSIGLTTSTYQETSKEHNVFNDQEEMLGSMGLTYTPQPQPHSPKKSHSVEFKLKARKYHL